MAAVRMMMLLVTGRLGFVPRVQPPIITPVDRLCEANGNYWRSIGDKSITLKFPQGFERFLAACDSYRTPNVPRISPRAL
jgi:hypothetical protein